MEAPTNVDRDTQLLRDVTDRIWQDAALRLHFTGNEILLPLNITALIGIVNVEYLKLQLSSFLSRPCVALVDNHLGCVRILARPDYQGIGDATTHIVAPEMPFEEVNAGEDPEANAGEKNDNMSENKAKVPRPPNAFILYRMHHHAILKDQDPDIHNNVISVTVGKKWNNESAEVKAHYKAMADEAKREHAAKYPDYQYAPRKPSEKKRRNTRRRSRTGSETASAEESASPQTPENSNILSVSDNEDAMESNIDDLLPFAEIPTPPVEGYEFTDFEMGEYDHWIDVAANAQEAAIIANHAHIHGQGSLQAVLPMMHTA